MDLSIAASQTRIRRIGRRFRKHRLATAAAIGLLALLASSALLLPYSAQWSNVQALDLAVRHAPMAQPVIPLAHYTTHGANRDPNDRSWSMGAAHRLSSWMGHDELGRSLLFRLALGFLVSAGIGLGAAMIALFIGVTWGMVAAYAGGRTDAAMMRMVDVLQGLPYLLTVILLQIALTRPLAALLGQNNRAANVVILFVAIGGISWLTLARVVRGQVLALRAQTFVEAARALGAGPLRILVRHMLPNLVGPIAVYATMAIPQAILQEAFLSFLGIGIQQPLSSLGQLAAEGVHAVNMYVSFWWLLLFPCGLLAITLLALNFIGDGLRDAFDPKSSAGLIT